MECAPCSPGAASTAPRVSEGGLVEYRPSDAWPIVLSAPVSVAPDPHFAPHLTV